MSKTKNKMISENDFAIDSKTKVENDDPRKLVFGQSEFDAFKASEPIKALIPLNLSDLDK